MIKSDRSELSRYYGNFRGVDFSSDHTLVSEKRFPYLVNMYKDYVSGGGQGIETIPGFRKRFVAPNGGKVHGIHSYKGKDSKRHVLVHAGTNLYDWKSFPNDAGVSKEIVAVVKEYDEYTSDIEGVGIEIDYIKAEIDIDTSREFVDVRAIRKVGAQKWISIYSDSVYYGETTDAVRLPGAYTITQKTANDGRKSTGAVLKIAKVIKDISGTVIASFAAGDSIEAQIVGISSYPGGYYSLNREGTYNDTFKTTADGSPIVYFEYGQSESPAYSTPLRYRINEQGKVCTFVSPDAVPQTVYESGGIGDATLINYIVASDGSKFAPISPGRAISTSWRVYFIKDKEQGYYYQPAADGSKIIKSQDTTEYLRVAYADHSWLTSKACTVLEYDEYIEDGRDDYFEIRGVDASYEIVTMRKSSSSDYITEGNGAGQYRRVGDIILLKKGGDVATGDTVTLNVKIDNPVVVYEEMSDRESKSFVFNNKLYILDGEHYLVYDGEVKNAADNAYIPTTYINIVPGGENADNGVEYEQRNILSPYFKHTFIADGVTKDYYLNENMLDGIKEIKVYGEDVTDYTVDLANGMVSFNTAPPRSETVDMSEGVKYPELYAGVEITAIKGIYPADTDGYEETESESFDSLINTATLATVFDNRVFFSGFASAPNLIVWSNLKNPSYIGILNYVKDGVGTTPITAILPVANALLVLKGDTEQDGAVYYHTPHDTGIDVMPKTYPSEAGLAGIGCLGAACNFLDDPVFVSRLGLKGISQYTSAKYERVIEHRSSLIDAKLVNLDGLKDAKICEWGGYLVLLVDGKIFLADSRQVYQNNRGEMEYEWYYLEDIGIFEGQYKLEKYITEWPQLFLDEEGNRVPITVTYEGKDYPIQLITDVLPDDAPTQVTESVKTFTGEITLDKSYGEGDDRVEVSYQFDYAIYPHNNGYVAVLCDGTGEQVGGTFCPAVTVKTINDGENGDKENLFFGTTNGVVCSFNFDKRENGVIPPERYSFDDRTIYSGCALKMDNCDIPHMTKTTVKKSTVIKVKSFLRTSAKVRVRTNKNPYTEIARISATRFDWEHLDFSDFSFVVEEDSLFSIREKEKKWVEKQYYIYSDEYRKPFALYYAAYKYFVAGKFKK